MSWWAYAIAAYLVMATQTSLASALAFETGFGVAQPQFALIFAVFIAIAAPANTALIACGVLGLLVDATTTRTVMEFDASGAVVRELGLTLIGPHTLGYLAGGYVVLHLRPMLFRQHPMTLGAMTLASGMAVHLIVVALLSVRMWYEPIKGFGAMSELTVRGVSLLYSAVLAVPLALALGALAPRFAFHHHGAAPRGRPLRVM